MNYFIRQRFVLEFSHRALQSNCIRYVHRNSYVRGRVGLSDSEDHIETTSLDLTLLFLITLWLRHLHCMPVQCTPRKGMRVYSTIRLYQFDYIPTKRTFLLALAE